MSCVHCLLPNFYLNLRTVTEGRVNVPRPSSTYIIVSVLTSYFVNMFLDIKHGVFMLTIFAPHLSDISHEKQNSTFYRHVI
jgi:hypothetical protein